MVKVPFEISQALGTRFALVTVVPGVVRFRVLLSFELCSFKISLQIINLLLKQFNVCVGLVEYLHFYKNTVEGHLVHRRFVPFCDELWLDLTDFDDQFVPCQGSESCVSVALVKYESSFFEGDEVDHFVGLDALINLIIPRSATALNGCA